MVRTTQVRIINAISQLPSGDVKKLQGNITDYRLRVGNYRIVFSKDDDENILISIIKLLLVEKFIRDNKRPEEGLIIISILAMTR